MILGWLSGESVRNGTTSFSSFVYWEDLNNRTYVYDKNSTIYNYIENYKTYLEKHGAEIEEARLIKIEELELIGCSQLNNSCSEAPSWVYSTSYWTGTISYDYTYVWTISNGGPPGYNLFSFHNSYGVRPVIKISKSKI